MTTTAEAHATYTHTTIVNNTLFYCAHGWLCDGINHWWRKPE